MHCNYSPAPSVGTQMDGSLEKRVQASIAFLLVSLYAFSRLTSEAQA